MNTGTDDFWSIPANDGFDQLLIRVYRDVAKPLDSLPYTSDFEELYRELLEQLRNMKTHGQPEVPTTTPTKAEVFRRLATLRKSGRLPTLFLPRAS